jgi:hypothetical protein
LIDAGYFENRQTIKMIPYKNINHFSSILAYESGSEWIRIEFVSGAVREYTYENVGKDHVEAMKKCAIKGKGLGSYVLNHEDHFKAYKKTHNVDS